MRAPPSNGPPSTRRIGKYDVLRPLARGGMAEILLASVSAMDGFEKLVVIKRILPQLAGEREHVQNFLDEARLAASLRHSNIAQVFDVGTDQGSPYFVMELLRGEDLRHVLNASVEGKRELPISLAVAIASGVCSALHYAHELRDASGSPMQIVHRDVSPHNVFVTFDGYVKLCDFGIAQSTERTTHTRTGMVKGKVNYMSPEQCQSEPMDRRSDIFSLSIVLWELLTQQRLFAGKNDLEIFKKIALCEVDPPSGWRFDIPPALDAIVMKGLSAWPKDRYQTARELQEALETWAERAQARSSPARIAAYMVECFGAPAPTVQHFIAQVTENDPLAGRIRGVQELETMVQGGAEDGVDPPTVARISSTRGSTEEGQEAPTVVVMPDAMPVLPTSHSAATVLVPLDPPRGDGPGGRAAHAGSVPSGARARSAASDLITDEIRGSRRSVGLALGALILALALAWLKLYPSGPTATQIVEPSPARPAPVIDPLPAPSLIAPSPPTPNPPVEEPPTPPSADELAPPSTRPRPVAPPPRTTPPRRPRKPVNPSALLPP